MRTNILFYFWAYEHMQGTLEKDIGKHNGFLIYYLDYILKDF